MTARHTLHPTLRPGILAVALAATAVTGCGDTTGPGEPVAPANRSFDDTFQWRGRVARGDYLSIRGIQGTITASLAPGDEVLVTATKSGPVDERRLVAIDVQRHAGGVAICAVYPDRWGDLPGSCGTGFTGSIELDDNEVDVAFTVQVPAGVVFLGSTVAGDVQATGLRSDAFVKTVAGDLRIATTELGEGTTVTGSVTASIGLADWDRDLRFSAVTGDVTVRVPAATNADVRASTVNGSIASGFALARPSPGSMRGTIGTGGRLLTLSAVTGNITLQRGP